MNLNTNIKIWLQLIVLLVIAQVSIAQILAETPFEKADRILKHSLIIFEGVVDGQTFYETTSGNCWTSNRVIVTRIFKGADKIDCGEVILVNPGSAGQMVDFGNGPYWLDAGSHAITFYEGAMGIFFCKLNDDFYPRPPTNPTINPFLRSSFEQYDNFLGYNYDPRLADTITIGTVNQFAQQFASLNFDSLGEAANFLNVGYGIDTSLFVKCELRPGILKDEASKNPVIVNPTECDTLQDSKIQIEDTEQVPGLKIDTDNHSKISEEPES